jgi:gas vesicle structural protein
MAIERTQAATNLVDVLDRVLDKGIVIDAWVRVSLVGIDLITVEARVVVASIATYLQYSETVAQMVGASKPSESAYRPAPTTAVRRRPRRVKAAPQPPSAAQPEPLVS